MGPSEGRRGCWEACYLDGIILSLPNFGDENGAVTALQDCRVLVLVQAFEDQSGQMGPDCRRDAFCGKIP